MPRGNPRLRSTEGHQNVVGPRVQARRKQLKLTQDALCARIAHATAGLWNPTEADIYRVESQKRIVSDLELIALCLALECDLLALMAEKPDQSLFLSQT